MNVRITEYMESKTWIIEVEGNQVYYGDATELEPVKMVAEALGAEVQFVQR